MSSTSGVTGKRTLRPSRDVSIDSGNGSSSGGGSGKDTNGTGGDVGVNDVDASIAPRSVRRRPINGREPSQLSSSSSSSSSLKDANNGDLNSSSTSSASGLGGTSAGSEELITPSAGPGGLWELFGMGGPDAPYAETTAPTSTAAASSTISSVLTSHFIPMHVTTAEALKWDRLPDETRDKCLAAVVRLLLFRGTRREPVSRPQVIAAMKAVSEDCRLHASAALKAAQSYLMNTFGLHLFDGSMISTSTLAIAAAASAVTGNDGSITSSSTGAGSSARASTTSEGAKYYLVNTLRYPTLRRCIAEAEVSLAESGPPSLHCLQQLRGMAFVALHTIWAAPGRRINAAGILKRLRQVDPSIAEGVVAASHHSRRQPAARAQGRHIDRNIDSEEESGEGESKSDEEEGPRSSSAWNRPSSRNSRTRSHAANYNSSSESFDLKLLIDKMLKEGFIVKDKTSVGGEVGSSALSAPEALGGSLDDSTAYTFGPRFFAEIGLRRLLLSYFKIRGLEPDVATMKEAEMEEARLCAGST